MTDSTCCAASRTDIIESTNVAASLPVQPQAGMLVRRKNASTEGMIRLKGGDFLMGSNDKTFPSDGEGPIRKVRVNPFWIGMKVTGRGLSIDLSGNLMHSIWIQPILSSKVYCTF